MEVEGGSIRCVRDRPVKFAIFENNIFVSSSERDRIVGYIDNVRYSWLNNVHPGLNQIFRCFSFIAGFNTSERR